ncbi:MAG: PAS domain-containing protein [Chloroflexales bacterium]|nr:PAS domain-containing protein [Chloroflexales bacterium]
MSLNPYAISLLITSVISGSLALYVWVRRAAPGSTLFSLMMAAVTLWSFAYGHELGSPDLATIRCWTVIGYAGIVTAPVLWLLFALRYSGLGGRLIGWQTGALFIIPALTLLLNATNERLHFFYYAAVALDASGPFPLLDIHPAPWYWVHVGYSYACVLVGALVLARLWLHSPSLYRGQTTVLLLGACLPLAANIAYVFGVRPLDHIDLSPLAFTATGLLITFGIFRYSLFDLTPIARNSLFEDLRDPVLVVDARGRLVDLNRAARQALDPGGLLMLGAPAAEALAHSPPLAALCADDDHAELALDTAPGHAYDAISTALCDRRGRLAGRIVVLRDISEVRRAASERLEIERKVQHTQKLESLGVLAGGIAHDFSNLLMAVLGNLDLARFEMPANHPAHEPLGDAERAARRAGDLTRQLLAYAGKGAFLIGPVNLSRLVEEITQLLRVSVGKLITFDLQLDPDLPVFEGDSAQIQQIVLNLITNAAEALGGQPGSITLTTGVCRCDADCLSRSRVDQRPAPGAFIYLAAIDTGHGMSPLALERVFEPFFTTKQLGRGLGMAAVLGIVRGHNGAILVDSALGQGTRVTVLFPVMGAEKAPCHDPRPDTALAADASVGAAGRAS